MTAAWSPSTTLRFTFMVGVICPFSTVKGATQAE